MGEVPKKEWMESVQLVFDYFCERTPRSFVEARETSVIWNYKYAGRLFCWPVVCIASCACRLTFTPLMEWVLSAADLTTVAVIHHSFTDLLTHSFTHFFVQSFVSFFVLLFVHAVICS